MNKNLLALSILASFIQFNMTALASKELAKINNRIITIEEFEKRYQDNLKYFTFKAPTKKAVLEDLIKREVGIQEAKKLKLDQDPDIQERINTVLYQALLEKKLGKEIEEITVTEDEAKSFYSKNPEFRTSHLFAACSGKVTKEEDTRCLERIKVMQAKLSDGKMTFAEVAQKFSEGVAAPVGGDIDFQSRDKLDPAYYEAAAKLSVGKVSPIVRTVFGYHLIKVTAIHSWDEVDRGMVKRLVFDQKRTTLFDKFITTLKAQAKVTTKMELLKE